jgi:hypothetical protein
MIAPCLFKQKHASPRGRGGNQEGLRSLGRLQSHLLHARAGGGGGSGRNNNVFTNQEQYTS